MTFWGVWAYHGTIWARAWRATFYVTGMAHSIAGGSTWESTPWRAVQGAAERWMLGVRCG